MIDAWKKLADVAGKYVLITAGEVRDAIQCLVRTLPDAVGVGIEDEGFFEYRFDQVTEGMMYHPIAKRRGGDQPLLWIVDVKTVILAGLIRFLA